MMNVTLTQDDYIAIAAEVKKKLVLYLPQEERQTLEPLVKSFLIGPEFLANTLRVSTPSTELTFDEDATRYVTVLKKTKQYAAHQELIDGMILYGQLLFSQTACLHVLAKIREELAAKPETEALSTEMTSGTLRHRKMKQPVEQISDVSSKRNLEEALKLLEELSTKDPDQSRLDILIQRRDFSKNIDLMKNDPSCQHLIPLLDQAKGFYYQVSDLNFKWANKPSRKLSWLINGMELWGGRIALIASIVAIGATALSFIPVLTPFMAPIATAASFVAFGVGLPVALKKIGTMIYNAIRFGVAPTKGEIVNAALLGTSLVCAGAGGIISHAYYQGLTTHEALVVSHVGIAANNITKASLGLKGQSFFKNHEEQKKALHGVLEMDEFPAGADLGA